MGVTTVVRSLVGTPLQIPGGVEIRPWAMVELESLSQEQADVIEVFLAAKHVSVGQLIDGAPVTSINLSRAVR